MKTEFRTSFKKDLRKIKDDGILSEFRAQLDVESAQTLGEIESLKKLKGTGNLYKLG